jgi:hypothetical protein
MVGVGMSEQEIDLLLLEVRLERLQVRSKASLDVALPLVDGQLGQSNQVLCPRLQLSPGGNLVSETLGLLGQALGPAGVLPDVGVA